MNTEARPAVRLTHDFFRRENVTRIARDLLGKYLVTHIDGHTCAGRIVETEAYRGPGDKACHAYKNRRTARTEPMFREGGIAYVYLCYGIHHLFNVVTGPAEKPHAVLIRALEPTDNIAQMAIRRTQSGASPRLAAGPGRLSQALGIRTAHTGASLVDPGAFIWIEDRGGDEQKTACGPRIGVEYAAECASWPWRFYWPGSPAVSK